VAATAATLVNRVRRFIRDFPDNDSSTASIASGGTTLTVADTAALYVLYRPLEMGQEALIPTAKPSGTTLTVRRGARGTTAASYASGTTILVHPNFLAQEILDALNSAIQAAFPLIYVPVLDTSLTTAANTFEYTVPNMPGTYGGASIPIQRVSKLELKLLGETDYVTTTAWDVRRGATPKLQFLREPDPNGTVRVHGFGPFPDLGFSDSLHTLWPVFAEDYLVWHASAFLLAAGEAGRVRADTGAVDNREQANRTGSSMSASNALYQRALTRLSQAAMPPLPKHCKAVF
jgi:hypothetical protein